MSYKLTFQPSGIQGTIIGGETVLDAARRLGEGLESVCGGQKVCGKCRVRPIKGEFSPVSAEETGLLSPDELAEGYRLACDARPLSDALINVPEESRPSRQVVLGSGSSHAFAIDPAVKNYYMELPQPGVEDPAADAERLKDGLARKYDLQRLSIAYPALRSISSTLREKSWKVTATVRHGAEVIRLLPGFVPEALGAAFDVGTTTIAGYLCDLASGTLLATDAMTNPQAYAGGDVMSRISYAASRDGAAYELREALIAGLNSMLRNMASSAGKDVKEIMEAVLVGNTVVHHLALGLPVGALGVYPFTPALSREMNFRAREAGLDINEYGYVVTLPVIGGFVGADAAAVIITEEPYDNDFVTLIADVGTNGELAVGNRQRLLTASCATGPAFEGAGVRSGMRAAPGAIERVMVDPETKEASYKVIGRAGWSRPTAFTASMGICGSGIVDAVAQMYRAGIIGPTGVFEKGVSHPRVRPGGEGGMEYVVAWARETATGKDITISASDVRMVQLAKAAVHAGAMVLMKEFGVDRPGRVVLAGAFGNFIDRENALAIGMLPPCDAEKVYSVGNAAGEGAKAALLSLRKRREARDAAKRAEHIELSLHPGFAEEFLASIAFPPLGA